MDDNKFITEDTIVNIDESIFEQEAKKLIVELFVDYVNSLHKTSVIELKNS